MASGPSARIVAEYEIADDIVVPFQTAKSSVRGRLVRLGPAVDQIIKRHNAPEPVSELLGQAVALTALLGTSLKFDGKLILQTKTDGPVDMLVVDFESPGRLRAYARYDKERIAALEAEGGEALQARLLGSGHLAMTIDQGSDMDRYQGIVGLEKVTLPEAALTYFRQSEQLPTFLRVAVARHYQASAGQPGEWRWRAGGILIQHLPKEGGKGRADDESEELGLLGEDDDAWNRAEILAATVEDHELLDPTLAPERLLYRLFHDEGVRVSPALPMEDFCRCSRERVEAFLKSFSADDLADMRESDGSVTVTCEFCNEAYRFEPNQLP
jgi:molecular chaperone Hsp33